MGFFKKMLSDVVGEETVNNLSEAITSKLSANPLATPAPPAVPKPQPSLSVMIAVNGQSYGPYERATLLEMIDNGTLTRDTLVYIQGMNGWVAAKDEPTVAALFGSGKAPAAPPVPWANAPAAPASFDYSLSPRLNQLITAAVADGEISDLERQVLIRNAQQEGVAMDEFVMVLEARLYEQRKVLQAQQEEKQRRDQAAAAQAVQPAQFNAPANAPQAPARPKLQKCPYCGAPYDELSTRCPECRRDYPSAVAQYSAKTAWEKLAEQLSQIDRDPSIKNDNIVLNTVMGNTNTRSFVKAKAIINFPIPVSKADLFEFATNCVPLAKKKSLFSTSSETPGDVAVAKAYYDKSRQAIIKARIVLKDDEELLGQLEKLAKQYKIKA